MKKFIMKLNRFKLSLLLGFVFLACVITIAEIEAEPATEPQIEIESRMLEVTQTPPAPLELPQDTLKDRMQKSITIEFRNTPIEDALMLMADQANVDIVKSPSVTGSVTVKLTDVPLGEALDNILAAHGYGYAADKNMIRIAPADEITQVAERIISRIYRITYADVKEVEAALKRFISKQGSVTYVKGTSNIIVTDTESQIKAIDEFIEEIDRITPQILVEVRIYDIKTDEDFDLGVEWNAGRNSTERQTNNPLTGTQTGVLVPDSTTYGVGMDTTPGDVTTAAGARAVTQRTSTPFVAGSYDELTGGSIRLGLLNDAIDIDVALNILHQQDFAKLLANPRIMVLDNEEATFEIIREIPYTEQTSTSSTTTQTVQFKEVGVQLKVVPHVTREGMVKLNIQPEFGVRVGTGAGAPTVDTRKLATIALVKDNQTVVLGGLRKNETTQDTWKVPIFGDLPLFGGLFRSETESIETNELVVFITPKIITEPTLSPEEEEQLEDTHVETPRKPDLTLDKLSGRNKE